MVCGLATVQTNSATDGRSVALSISCALGPSEAHTEHRSLSELAAHGEVAAHASGEIAANRQAEPCALALAVVGTVDLHEWLEDRLELIGRNTDAGVDDVDEHIVIRHRTLYVNA